MVGVVVPFVLPVVVPIQLPVVGVIVPVLGLTVLDVPPKSSNPVFFPIQSR